MYTLYTFTHFTIHTNNIISKKKKCTQLVSNTHTLSHIYNINLNIYILLLEEEIHEKSDRE